MTTRVIVVAKRSFYSRFVEEESDPRARALIRHNDRSVKNWLPAHREHLSTLESVEKILADVGAHVLLLRGAHAAFHTSDASLVITVGGDGTLLAASHNVAQVPVLGVNSAPRHSIGFFCAANKKTLREHILGALDGRLKSVTLARMRVTVNGRVRSERVLNEALFCHASPAATSRYILRFRGKAEEQRSSGLWIGPAAGSTAAQRSAGGDVLPLRSRDLQLVVREPYLAYGRSYRLLKLRVTPRQSLTLQSKMQSACLFLDGPYKQIPVQLGDDVGFSVSDQPLCVLGLDARRSRSAA
jgi:NAD+ kinase